MKMYSVFDVKAAAYHRPVTYVNDATAARDFGVAANDRGTEIGSHPEDFSLVYVGEFNPDTGEIKVPQKLHVVATAASMIRQRMPIEDLIGNALKGKSVEEVKS